MNRLLIRSIPPTSELVMKSPIYNSKFSISNSRPLGILLMASLALLFVGCRKEREEANPKEKTLYTCGMHPQVIQDKPGLCPICGMKLEPIRRTQQLSIDPTTIQNMGIRTAVVARGP